MNELEGREVQPLLLMPLPSPFVYTKLRRGGPSCCCYNCCCRCSCCHCARACREAGAVVVAVAVAVTVVAPHFHQQRWVGCCQHHCTRDQKKGGKHTCGACLPYLAAFTPSSLSLPPSSATLHMDCKLIS